MSCHAVHKNLGPTVIDFDDDQPRLDLAGQRRAESRFFVLSWARSSPAEPRQAEMAPFHPALTRALPGTAFPRAQVRPQHLLVAVGTLGRRQGLPGSVTACLGAGCEPRAAYREPRAASSEPRVACSEPRAARSEPQLAARQPAVAPALRV